MKGDIMKLIFALLLLSSKAFAYQETAIGKIFLGGFTFPKENYLSTSIQIEKTDQEIYIKLNPLETYGKCIKEFGIGVFEYSEKQWFSDNMLVRYKIPVTQLCSENGSKLYKIEIVYRGDTEEIKSVRLSPYRSKSYPYFSTEF